MTQAYPIRFVNLDRDAERRIRMQAELDRLGLAGERFPGVLWTALTVAEQSELYSERLNARSFHQPLVNGEKGCYASHIALMRWLLESPHSAVLVLEDDVCLKDDFASVIEALARRPGDWDMVKLIGREEIGKAEKFRDQQPLHAGYCLVRYRRLPSLTAGYVLSRRGAEKILATRVPFGRPVDVDLRHWWESQSLQVLGIAPSLITLDVTSEQSSIGSKASGGGLGRKFRKAWLMLRYTLGNAWHRQR